MTLPTRVVIVGNGMVGLRLVEELVKRGKDRFAITVVGREEMPAYNRVLLSPLLAGEINESDVTLNSRDWYADNNVRLILNARVTEASAARKHIVLDSGGRLDFDVCVFATGSEPMRIPIPGCEHPDVMTFRDLTDAKRLIGLASGRSSIAVIGGGLLGIETAYGLARAGADVTLVHLMDRLMERQLDAEGAALLKTAVERKGIRVLLDAQTRQIEASGSDGTGNITGFQLTDGRRFLCDRLVMAVGISPTIEPAKNTGCECGRGIVVDDRMQTSQAGIFAIGECAEHRGTCYGLVEPGYAQAACLAAYLNGEDVAYNGTTVSTNLKVSGVPVFSAGEFPDDNAEIITTRDSEQSIYRKFYIRDNRLVGVVLVGDTHDALWYRDLIATGDSISNIRPILAFGQAFAEAA